MTLRTVCRRAARTRRGPAGMVIGVAAIGLGVYAGFAGQPAQAGNGAEPGLAVAAPAAARLDQLALTFAKANGDGHPSSITAVITTHGSALTSATPGDTEPALSEVVVYLITMHGHFIARMASVPPGAKLPVGSYLAIVVNARTFALMDWGVNPAAPHVSPASLGPVRSLKV